MSLSPKLQNRIANILSQIPVGVRLEWEVVDGVIQFSITERPVTFSSEQELALIDKLNNAVFSSDQKNVSEKI